MASSALQVDFIGIGAPKCGTTWLFYALGQHPVICLSEPKETKYFSRDDFSGLDPKTSDPLSSAHDDDSKDLTSYARHYKHCSPCSLKGEFSPGYIYHAEAPSRIHRHFPNVKLLVCLRNPVDRAHSRYWDVSRYEMDRKFDTFEAAIAHDPRYLLGGYYAKNLKSYLEYFSKSQIKIILFENIVKIPQQTINEVFAFLGLSSDIQLDLDMIPKNTAKRSRFLSPGPLMSRASSWLIEHGQATLLRKVRDLGVKRLLMDVSTVQSRRDPIDQQTRDRLQRLFRDDIDELESLFGLDLTSWK